MYRPIDVDLFKACYPWSVLDLHVGEIHILPVSNFYIIIDDPHATQKASVGIYDKNGVSDTPFSLSTVHIHHYVTVERTQN